MTAETRRMVARHILEKLRCYRAVRIELLSLRVKYIGFRGRQRRRWGRKGSYVEFRIAPERR